MSIIKTINHYNKIYDFKFFFIFNMIKFLDIYKQDKKLITL